MRLVMKYYTDIEFSYYSVVALPIIHESPESALVEFEELYNAARAGDGQFMFAGASFYTYEFCGYDPNTYIAPEFLTLDEWYGDCNA